jgi:hypothetical protein
MPTVEFVDTSILVNLLNVPHLNQRHAEVVEQLQNKRAEGVQFILPITAVIETGNHIAQVSDGYHRRACAERFVSMLAMVAEKKAPWVLHELGWDAEFLLLLVDGASSGTSLIDHASAQVGCGDLSILAERDRYLGGVSKGVRAAIWTLDHGLAAWS